MAEQGVCPWFLGVPGNIQVESSLKCWGFGNFVLEITKHFRSPVGKFVCLVFSILKLTWYISFEVKLLHYCILLIFMLCV